MAIGLARSGIPGALAAWLGFTLPSALLLVAFAWGVVTFRDATPPGLLHGLKIVAVALVAQALWGTARSLAPDRPRVTLAVLAATAALFAPSAATQIGVIALGATAGLALLRAEPDAGRAAFGIAVGKGTAVTASALVFLLLVGLPLLAAAWPWQPLALLDSFYRTGGLVFGDGNVVLPLLQAEVVPRGWVGPEAFVAGYGAAQAVPGPLFTFAVCLGAVMGPWPNGGLGALIRLLAIVVPSFLLILGVLPFWEALRHLGPVRRALSGVNAALVGLLLAALDDPVWTSGIHGRADPPWRWPPSRFSPSGIYRPGSWSSSLPSAVGVSSQRAGSAEAPARAPPR
ncbi:MAG: chromate efflux transporter [Geminicoccaceae bacterium]